MKGRLTLVVLATLIAVAVVAAYVLLRGERAEEVSTGTITPTETPTRTPEGTVTQTPSPTPTPRTPVKLLGSGATFVHPQLDYWAKKFMERFPHVTIEYNPTGSGAGQAHFLDKLVDFACSDPPLRQDRWQQARNDPRGVVQLPVVVGSVVVIYNIPGLEGRLRLNGEVLSLIYLGEIEYWNDPRIAALNPGLKLPSERIIAVHRSDASGTTQIFTSFLHRSSGGLWPGELVGLSVDWPVDRTGRGLGGKGNQGIADIVARTPYSIGYVEYAFAKLARIPYALIANAEGEFVDATPESMARALVGAMERLPKDPRDDFSEFWNAVIFARGKGVYPITSFSFIILYEAYPPEKAEAIKAFVEFIYKEGRNYLVEGYVAVPDEIAAYALRALELIRSG